MSEVVGIARLRVSHEHLARTNRTGVVHTLATSALSALMEEAACRAIEGECKVCEFTSVAASMNVRHRRPSAYGANVTAYARIDKIDREGIHFDIQASDETGVVGTAKHIRVFVKAGDYEKRCYEVARLKRRL